MSIVQCNNGSTCAMQQKEETAMMSFENNMKLGQELYELNSVTLKKLMELDADSFTKLMEMNKSFGEGIPEMKGLVAFMDMQREYGKALWDDSQEAMKTKSEIIRDAFEQAGEIMVEASSTTPPKKETAKKAA